MEPYGRDLVAKLVDFRIRAQTLWHYYTYAQNCKGSMYWKVTRMHFKCEKHDICQTNYHKLLVDST